MDVFNVQKNRSKIEPSSRTKLCMYIYVIDECTYLRCLTNLSEGAKHPTQSERRIHPLAWEDFEGLLVSCLQIWQYISSLSSARSIPCPIIQCNSLKRIIPLIQFSHSLGKKQSYFYEIIPMINKQMNKMDNHHPVGVRVKLSSNRTTIMHWLAGHHWHIFQWNNVLREHTLQSQSLKYKMFRLSGW